MSKKTKYLVVLSMIMLAALSSVYLGLNVFASSKTVVGLFEDNANFTLTPSQTVAGDTQKGLLIETVTGNASLELKSEMSGIFRTEFRIKPGQVGTADYESLSFTFTDKDSGRHFKVTYVEIHTPADTDAGTPAVTRGYIRVNISSSYVDRNFSKTYLSFNGTTPNVLKFSFDPQKMVIYDDYAGTPSQITDLSNETDILRYHSAYTYSGFERYSVAVSFGGIAAGKTAKMIMYSINGHSLSENTVSNDAGPVIFSAPPLFDGVVGKGYKVPVSDFPVFDFIDGYGNFMGTVSVTDPNGTQQLTGGSNTFVPAAPGRYGISYFPQDKNGVAGPVYSDYIDVLSKHPVASLEFDYPMTHMTAGTGSVISFPAARAYSKLARESSIALNVEVKVLKAGSVIKSASGEQGSSHKFEENGTYAVSYSVTDYVGVPQTENFTVTIETAPVFTLPHIEPIIARGTLFNVPNATAELAGSAVSIQKTLIYPDGRKGSYEYTVLDVSGEYILRYDSVYNSKTYSAFKYFKVKTLTTDMFIRNGEATIIKGNVDQPYYADDIYNGVLIATANEKDGVTVANSVNLSDNTQADTLIEFAICPQAPGIIDFTELRLKLTDVNDSDNWVTIIISRRRWSQQSIDVAVELSNGGSYIATDGTTNIMSSFLGKYYRPDGGAYPSQAGKLHYDFNENALYASVVDRKLNVLLVDFDDPATMGVDYVWEGFSTGEVYMSLSTHMMTSVEAKFIIMEIDGQSLSGTYINDAEKPSIFINCDVPPQGEKGIPYKIFSAYANDKVEGKIIPQIAVYYTGDGVTQGIKERIRNISSGSFIPDKAGFYEIVYSAVDSEVNYIEKSIVVEIVEPGVLTPLSYTFSMTDTAEAGETILIEGASAGGTGAHTVEISVSVGGVYIDVADSRFMPVKGGDYTVTATVSDYIRTQPFTHNIHVSVNEKPTIYEVLLPKSILVNEQIVFPEAKAVDYYGGTPKIVGSDIYVNGVKLGPDRTFTPTGTGSLTVIYKATGSGGMAESEPYTINVKAVSSTFLATYFDCSNNIGIGGNSQRLTFTTTNNLPATVDFIKSVPAGNFSTRFSVSENAYNFGIITIILTDSLDPSIKVKIEIFKHADSTSLTSYVSINGGKQRPINGSFYGNTAIPFEIRYNHVTRELTDYSGLNIGTLDKTMDGRTFKGFASEKLYLSFSVGASTGAAAINIMTICGQPFSASTKSDLIGPTIVLSDEIIKVEINGTLTAPAAVAYDILGTVASLSVEIFAPGGAQLYSGSISAPVSVTADKYGQYIIIYTAIDNKGNKNIEELITNVFDRTPPVITLKSELAQNVKLGKTIDIPQAEVTDNNSTATEILFYVYCVGPYGETVVLKENSFTPTIAGRYIIVHYAMDKYGATTILKHTVTVSE